MTGLKKKALKDDWNKFEQCGINRTLKAGQEGAE